MCEVSSLPGVCCCSIFFWTWTLINSPSFQIVGRILASVSIFVGMDLYSVGFVVSDGLLFLWFTSLCEVNSLPGVCCCSIFSTKFSISIFLTSLSIFSTVLLSEVLLSEVEMVWLFELEVSVLDTSGTSFIMDVVSHVDWFPTWELCFTESSFNFSNPETTSFGPGRFFSVSSLHWQLTAFFKKFLYKQ